MSAATATQTQKEELAQVSAEDVAFFEREGYLINGPILPKKRIDELDAYVTQMIDELPEGKRPEELDMPHPQHPWLLEWLSQDAILDLVEPIVGPDIVLWASHFICKPAGVGKRVPWHQDSGYWTRLALPRRVVTLWLAVDDSDKANGCMKVIPGTHKHKYENYEQVSGDENVFARQLERKYIDEEKVVDIEMPRGFVSFHDGWTIHGSNPNTSDRRRCGYTMRYFAPDQECLDKNHPLYLVRGEDRFGVNTYRNR